MEESEYLSARLDDQIGWYDKKSGQHQKWYKWLKMFQIIAGGSIPIVLSFKSPFYEALISALSAAIIVFESIIALYGHHDNWIEYRKTSELLKHEKYMYLTGTGVYKNEDDGFALLVERCETIISSENINWANLQTDTEKRKEKKQ